MPAISPIIILDAGPLKAAADVSDPHHRWTLERMLSRVSPFIVTSAAIAEATHILKNGPRALEFLEKIVERMQVEDPAPAIVLAEMRKW